MICLNAVNKSLSNYLCTLHWHAFTNALHKRVIWNLPRANICEAASNTWLKHLLAVEKNIYAQAKIIKSLHHRLELSKKISEWLFIHITLETASNEMQCDKTISHMVTAGRSYFRTLRNECVTAGKTTMTAGKIYHGCFEMLSWPHRTSANITNIRFWLLETCTKCYTLLRKTYNPALNGWHLKLSTSISYAGHVYTVGRQPVLGQVSRQSAFDVLRLPLPSGGTFFIKLTKKTMGMIRNLPEILFPRKISYITNGLRKWSRSEDISKSDRNILQ